MSKKEVVKERKCLSCGEILPRKSRKDKKTCSAYCRKKLSIIAKVGNTDYRKSEVSKEAKELFNDIENKIESLRHIQWLVLVTDTTENTTSENYKELFKNYTVDAIERLIYNLKGLSNEVLKTINISQLTDILDDLDDRDNNLYPNKNQ
ncbi:hypothetical protein WAF17_04420 [Bernardetia sp. ABR2-2B]|uniref:hypothetical protein n=1 Tax=Bernardetia sp. ABR2-2B TaxID=3127472 RepID=UPI0030D4EE88